MGIIEKGIQVNSDNTISFGNHLAIDKVKIDDFKIDQDIYKLRSYNEVTRFTKNHALIFESTPGVTVHNFSSSEEKTTFNVEGVKNPQVTLELVPDITYKITSNGVLVDEVKANGVSGKVSFSLELKKGISEVIIVRV